MCVAAVTARGQEVLFSNSRDFETFPIGSALSDLGIDHTFVQTNQQTLDALRSQPWDLVVMRRQERFLPGFEADVLAELEAHVAAGGRLHFQMTDLENLPDGWYDLLGLEGAVDLELPLSDIEFAPPKHPSVPGGGFHALRDDTFPPDYGDALVPGVGSTVTQRFVVDQRPSTVLSRSGRVLVNGQQWDNWFASGAAGGTIGGQIRWLLRCPADLDLDGAATLADFLVFQNLFDRRDTVADVDGDGAWTVFDFLAFLNQFEAGC
ncbi:hypothetical protein AY599_22685 [Leptolyngbya valderiana BDU 20041]|nr:hypothetical protein AY599_22685 [Leptolyngbya valderiana BDU 20041]